MRGHLDVVGATPAAGVPTGGPAWSHAPACRAYHELVVARLTGGRATVGPGPPGPGTPRAAPAVGG